MNRIRSYYRENRSIFRTIFYLSWPAVVEQALQTLVQYIDTAMVGRLGAQASASVGLTSTMTWLVNAPLFAMGIGVLSSIAESIGAGREGKGQAVRRSVAVFRRGSGTRPWPSHGGDQPVPAQVAWGGAGACTGTRPCILPSAARP